MKYIVLICGLTAAATVLFVALFENLMDSSRPFVGMAVISSGITFVLGIALILGRFVGICKASDFWVSLLMVLLVSPIIGLYLCGKTAANARLKRSKENTLCYNLTFLGQNLIEYAKAHRYCLPDANSWCDDLIAFNPEICKENFLHPKQDIHAKTGECHVAFNAKLSEMDIRKIADNTVLLFESDGAWNLHGNSELIFKKPESIAFPVPILYMDQIIRNYWFEEKAVRFFDRKRGLIYCKPKWEP